MKKNGKNVLWVTFLVLNLFLTTNVYAAFPLDSSDSEIVDALNYLKGKQQADGNIGGFGTSSWVVSAITAAGEDAHDWKTDPSNPSIVDYLKVNGGSLSSATDYERYILSIVAANEDPTTFGGHDYLADLRGFYNNYQMGSIGLLNDDFWGIIALVSAGVDPLDPMIQNTVQFIKDNQETDGSWGFTPGWGDADDTCSAIIALIAAGEKSDEITDGLEFVKSMQNDDGGFASSKFFDNASNAATDALCISAIVAVGQDPTSAYWTKNNKNPVDHILSLQRSDGSFDWKSGVMGMGYTEEAIVALLGAYYPVAVIEDVNVHMRIEGRTKTLWGGEVTVKVPYEHTYDSSGNSEIWNELNQAVAIETIDDNQDLDSNGINEDEIYSNDVWGSYFIQSIAGEENVGWYGWSFRVNGESAMDSAENVPLSDGDDILWYYGGFTTKATRISDIPITVSAGDSFKVTVECFDGTEKEWCPCEGVYIYVDGTQQMEQTDSNGEIEITIMSPGEYQVWSGDIWRLIKEEDPIGSGTFVDISGTWKEFTRSEKHNVTVKRGGESGGTIDLEAYVVPAISLTVEPEKINFGYLGAGYNSQEKKIYLTNKGSWNLRVTAEVVDEVGNLFTENLWLNDELWSTFSEEVEADISDFKNELEVSAEIRVPGDYTETGVQEGSLTLWVSGEKL